jgi:hypothetical protein
LAARAERREPDRYRYERERAMRISGFGSGAAGDITLAFGA